MRPVAPGLVRTPDAQARLDDLERRYGDFATFVAKHFGNPVHAGWTPAARRARISEALAETRANIEAAKARRSGT